MTDQEAYAKGLEKLGLWKPGEKCDWYNCLIPHRFAGRMHEDHEIPTIDLRQDPAFAWRALTAYYQHALRVRRIVVFPTLEDMRHLADALYAAVCALGREDS